MKNTFDLTNLKTHAPSDPNRFDTPSIDLRKAAHCSTIGNIIIFTEAVQEFERDYYDKHIWDEVPFTEGWDADKELTQLFLTFYDEWINEETQYPYFRQYCMDKLKAIQEGLEETETCFCQDCGSIVPISDAVTIGNERYCLRCGMTALQNKINSKEDKQYDE